MLASVLAAGALALGTAAPVAAAAQAAPPVAAEVVGGEELGTSGIAVGADAPALPEVAAAGWLLADLDTGQVLAAKDPHGLYAPASTLKMLTAVALLPVLHDRVEPIVPTFSDIAVEGSKVGLVEGVGYPVQELFAALLMVSGNDAALTLGSAAGGRQATATLMNDKARELGALDTRAVNPHGLDAPGQVSSAYDLALLARAGLADERFARYVSTRRSSVSGPAGKPRIEIVNKNKMLKDYPGSFGVKNGFTSAARASYVGAAERDGRRLVVTLMKGQPKIFDEAAKLLDWGFAAGNARPVGTLNAQETEDNLLAAVAGSGVAGSARDAAEGAGGLPVTLAGFGLGAAAVCAARRRPARESAAGRRRTRTSARAG